MQNKNDELARHDAIPPDNEIHEQGKELVHPRRWGGDPAARRLLALLYAERDAVFAYTVALLLGGLILLRAYPVSFFLGEGSYFQQFDAAAHVSGWLFYAADTWHFPLLHTERLNYPQGTSVAFTDSIPLAALAFKTIAGWLPAGFQYIGLWHAVVYLAQAIAATLLVRALGLRHVLGVVAAVVFATTWPALLHRLWHTALMTHSLLLFALAFYVLGREGRLRSGSACAALFAVSLIGLTIHPYFFAFCYPLFLAFMADQMLSGESWKKQLPRLGLSIVLTGATGFVLGYFGSGGTVTGGFDEFSMNLRAPFCGGRFMSCLAVATEHQGEGLNYFGAGLLLLLPFAAIGSRPALKTVCKRYPVLLVLLVLFSLYALSNAIYWGKYLLFSYSVPTALNWITGTFRASGRFFWIVGYAILFASLAVVLRKPSWKGVALLGVALSLQWADTRTARELVHEIASRPPSGDLEPWAAAMSGIEKVNVYPAYGCGDAQSDNYLFFQRLAAQYRKRISTGYIARLNSDCSQDRQAFDAPFPQGQLYVFNNPARASLDVPAGFRNAARRGECAAWQNTILCLAGKPAGYWRRIGVGADGVNRISEETVQWTAAELPATAGILENGSRRLRAGQSGYLGYGPYIRTSEGRYRFRLRYASDAEGRQVGTWDVMLNDPPRRPPVQIAAGPLVGTAGKEHVIVGEFDVAHSGRLLEIRTLANGEGDLRLNGLTIEKLR
jgi:Family of unknown function (DUF6311)